MEDLMLSLVVIVCTAAVVFIIFLIVGKKRKARTEGLSSYCNEHRLEMSLETEPTGRVLTVTSENWSLTSSMRAGINESSSGSSEWQKLTEWTCTKHDPNRPIFALHCSGSSANMDALPQWVRAAAIEKLRQQIGGSANTLSSVRTAFSAHGVTGIVFEPESMSAHAVLERIEREMSGWKKEWPLYIESSPERAAIRTPGLYIANAEQLDRLLHIGETLV